MNGKTGTIWRKAVAAALALTVVAGGVPAQIFPSVFADNAIVASADTTVSSASELQNAINSGGTISISSDIQLPSSESYFKIGSGKTVTIILNGHTISGNGTNCTLYVNGGNLTVKDSGTGGGKITGGARGGVNIDNGGSFTLEGGSITKNTSSENTYGGGVTVSSGTFTMNGGSVTENILTSNGSKIIGCAGVLVNGGTFNFNGGEISYNAAGAKGEAIGDIAVGGVYVNNSGSFTMNEDSKISNNIAWSGSKSAVAGVYCEKGTADIKGGSITENENHTNTENGTTSGAGLRSASNEGVINLSGKIIIKGNKYYKFGDKTSVESDVYIGVSNSAAAPILNVTGSLAGSLIGIDTTYSDTNARAKVYTKGFKDNNPGTATNAIFFADDPVKDGYSIYVGWDVNKAEVKLAKSNSQATPHKANLDISSDCEIVSQTPSNLNEVNSNTPVSITLRPKTGYVINTVQVMMGTTEVATTTVRNEDGSVECSFMMPGNDITLTVTTTKVAVSLYGHQIVLNGDIGLVYYMSFADEATAQAAKMDFVIGDKTVSGVEGKKNGQYYTFTCPTTSKEMTTKVKATLKKGNDTLWSDTEGYSVKDFTEEYFGDSYTGRTEASTDLINAMLDYGAAAQTYFDGVTDAAELANGGTPKNTVGELKGWQEQFIGDAAPFTTVGFYGSRLELESTLRFDVYFKGDVSVTVSGGRGVTTSKEEVGGIDCTKVSVMINPWDLATDLTFTVGSTSITYSPKNYCYKAMNNNAHPETLKTLLKALSCFGNAALEANSK